MQTDQEHLFMANSMVSGVTEYLIEFASCSNVVELGQESIPAAEVRLPLFLRSLRSRVNLQLKHSSGGPIPAH